MSLKSPAVIHPSITSQAPRFTALMGEEGGLPMAKEREQKSERKNRSATQPRTLEEREECHAGLMN